MQQPPIGLTVTEFAEMIGKTPQRVYQLIEEEAMPHRVRGEGREAIRIVLEEAWSWLYERAMQKAAAATPAPDPEAEQRIRKRRLEAERIELDLQTLRGQRLDRAEVDAFHRGQEGAFFAFMTGQLQRFEPDIVRAIAPVDARRLTQRMMREILEARRNYAEELETEAAAIELADNPTKEEVA